jgi:hypothetical protein
MGNDLQSAIGRKSGADITPGVLFFAFLAGSRISSFLRVFVVNRDF